MKTYIVLPHQYVSPEYNERISSVRANDAILPKKLVDENNNHILQQLTYKDLLLTLDSEFDVITTSNHTVSLSVIVNNDREIQSSMMKFNGKIAYLDDDVVDFLGYKSSKLITKKGMKIAKYTSNGEYFVFADRFYGMTIHKKEALITMCKELLDKKFVRYVDISIGERSTNWIKISNDSSIEELEGLDIEIKNTKKKVQLRSIYFNKVFNREEANELIRIVLQCIELPSLVIQRAELEDLYTLV